MFVSVGRFSYRNSFPLRGGTLAYGVRERIAVFPNPGIQWVPSSRSSFVYMGVDPDYLF